MAWTAEDDAARRCCRVELSASPITDARAANLREFRSTISLRADFITPLIATEVNILHRWVLYDIHTTLAKVIYSW